MKKILFILLLFPLLVLGQSKDRNYVKTLVYKKESSGAITALDTVVNVDYFDGLGRRIQSVAVKGGGGNKDVIQHVEYNESGKQQREYLPYAASGRVSFNSPNYRYDLVTTQASYYKTQFPLDVYGTDAFTYSEIKTDGSPLGRVVEQAAPGNAWAMGSGHTIKTEYNTNTVFDQVYDFRVKFTNNDTEKPEIYIGGNGAINSQYYAVRSLYKTVTKDENWISTDDNNKTTHEFKDKQGRLILKRTFNAGVAHDTYYVYDRFGNLTCVIPPQAFATTGFITSYTEDFLNYYAVNQVILSKFSYFYKYDSRNRVIEKQVPDKGIEYVLYDKLDRPVLTQNANQRIAQKWSFVKYDKFGRIVYSGEYTTTKSIDVLKAELNAATVLSENKTDSTFFTLNGTNVNYTNNTIPKEGIELYTINYYDTTTFSKPTGMEVPTTVAFGTTSTLTKALPTGIKVRVIEPGSTSWITTVIGYDVKGRVIWAKNDNPYYATNNTIETKLNYIGQITETKTVHSKNGNTPIAISDYYEYDFVGRPTTHKQQIDNTAIQTISNKTYNERGQLLGKALGGSGASGAQKIDYAYNVRGWLTQINDPNNLNVDIFSESLSYNLPPAGGTALFNGNISQASWKTSNDNNLRTYNYKYDALNRITSGIFTNSTVPNQNNNFNLNSVTYDRNGNIAFMHRAGDIVGGGNSQINMDYMTYVYEGNKLLRIKEDGDQTKGFKGGNPLSLVDQYQYDSMGNLTADTNKGITKIEYNHLGLPSKVSFGSSKYISYVYDGKGNKLKKVHFNGLTTATTEYNTGIIYLKSGVASSTLQYIPTEEGYAFKNAGGTFSYAYQLKDHLGNVRITFTDLNNNSLITTDEIIEEANYDPFGMKHTGYNPLYLSIGNSFAQKLKFNGKEYEEGLVGLDYKMNEMDWRHYDPAIGKFNCIDKLAERDYSSSSYSFAFNNPIYWVDPSGLSNVPNYIAAMWNATPDGSNSFWKNNNEGSFSSNTGLLLDINTLDIYNEGGMLPAIELTVYKRSGGYFFIDGVASRIEEHLKKYLQGYLEYASNVASPVGTIGGIFEQGAKRALKTENTLTQVAKLQKIVKIGARVGAAANVIQFAHTTTELIANPTAGNATKLGVQVTIVLIEAGANILLPGSGVIVGIGLNILEQQFGDELYKYMDQRFNTEN